ncbi:hypothetical protein DFJ73DRAFT_762619 [Zopfochytrium polystomum]|nr:hypothetical protein DFJ73DRAFT_762619 [Zopfochytrium polystomum]
MSSLMAPTAAISKKPWTATAIAIAILTVVVGSLLIGDFSYIDLNRSQELHRLQGGSQKLPADGVPSRASNLLRLKNQPFHMRTVRIPHPLHIDDGVKPAPSAPPTNSRRFSHFRCFGDENSVEGYTERGCSFENVCYNLESRTIQFYRRPGIPPRPVLFDAVKGERYQFEDEGHGFVNLQLWESFGPIMVDNICPAAATPDSTLVLTQPHFLWSNWARDDNLGHVLWEEISTIWYTMIRLNAFDPKVVAMHGLANDLPDRPLANKFRKAFFPAVLDTDPVSIHSYMRGLAEERLFNGSSPAPITDICFDQLMAGGNMQRFVQRNFWHNQGHEPLFYGLRGRIIDRFNLTETVPTSHRILVTNKTNSMYHDDPALTNHRGLHNLPEVIDAIKARYPSVPLQVVQWDTLSVRDQISLLLSSTLVVTPPGGVSMLLPFLPEGAHAIIFDYLEKEDNWFVGSLAGRSISMEAPFWNHWPHFKKSYYQVFSKEQMISDDPRRTLDEVSWRDEASIVVNIDKILGMVDAAFEEMAP